MTAVDTRVNPAASTGAPARFGIGELSARTGVSARSLRYYEEQGLLDAALTAAGHRRFDAEAVDRVLLVQRLFAAGLTSTEIAPLLPALLGRTGRTQHDGIASLRTHRRALEARIARLRDTAEILDEVLEEHAPAR